LRRERIVLVSLFFLFCFFSGFFLGIIIFDSDEYQVQHLTDVSIAVNSNEIGGDYGIFKHYYYEEGGNDFAGWYIASGDFSIFENSEHLYLYHSAETQQGIVRRNLPDISTYELRECAFYITLSYFMSEFTFYIRIYYTDNSYTDVFEGTTQEYEGWKNATLDAGKTYAYSEIKLEMTAGTGECTLMLLIEEYAGYYPKLANWGIISGEKKVDENVNFFCEAYNESGMKIFYEYADTGQTNDDVMTLAWQDVNLYVASKTFKREGIYYYYYLAYNEWGLSRNTDKYYLFVSENPYPRSAYLSLYSTVDGLPLESKDYKIYLGVDEEKSLVDFIDYFGNWSQLYASNQVNATFIDNYIRFSARTNGLKTSFEDGEIIDTLIYNVLLFEIKVENPLWLALVYNPQILEKTYYIYFNSSQVGTWYNVIIPFFNFTIVKDVTHDLMQAVGFYVDSGAVNLANIRVAHYYDANCYNQTLNYTDFFKESKTVAPEHDYIFENDSVFETNFNYTNHFESENCTIENNETLKLSLTGDYIAEYSFTDDTNGAHPANWSVTDTGTKVEVQEDYKGHHKVLYCEDNSASYYWELWQDYSAQNHGTVEFWVLIEDSTKYCRLLVLTADSGSPNYAVFLQIDGGNLETVDSSPWTETTVCAIENNAWYHIRVDFETSADGYLGIPQYKHRIYVNQVYKGEYNNYAEKVGVYRTVMSSYSYTNTPSLYYDAIDYSWADGYFTNRNLNNTYYPEGYYISKSYDLGNADYYYYQNLTFSRSLGPDTNFTLQYRTSANNETWSEWSSALTSNITINAYKDRYFQFRANLTSWGNYTYTPQLLWVSLTYKCEWHYYIVNETKVFNFNYNFSCWIIEKSIYNVTLNLTASQYSALYLYNYSAATWENVTRSNLTNYVINTDYYNLTQFRLQIYANFTSDYSFFYSFSLKRDYYELWNLTNYSSNSYRLISDENRQNPNELIFDSRTLTLAILDYFDNVLYRRLLNWSEFVDAGLPIATLIIQNNYNYSILVEVERGLGVTLQIVVPPESAYSIRVFVTNYQLKIRNLEMQLLNMTSISFNQSKNVVVQIGERQAFEIPSYDFWQILQEFFFGSWYGICLFVLIIVGVAFSIANLLLGIYRSLAARKRRRKKKRQSDIDAFLRSFNKKAEVD